MLRFNIYPRTELMVLEFKKDQCKKELDSATKELNGAQEKINDAEELGMSYDDVRNDFLAKICMRTLKLSLKCCWIQIVALIQERDELRARFRRGEASKTTIAERQELERALHTAREELFRERKYKREQIEELEEVSDDNNVLCTAHHCSSNFQWCRCTEILVCAAYIAVFRISMTSQNYVGTLFIW